MGQCVSINRSALNCSPCNGLVRMFAGISSVARCSILISPSSTLSFNQKYLIAMCLDLSELAFPFASKCMHERLSW